MQGFRPHITSFIALCALSIGVSAQPPEATDPKALEFAETESARLRTLAEHIDALIDGTLDPSIEVESLFEAELGDFAKLRSDDRPLMGIGSPVYTARSELLRAQLRFVSLAKEEQSRLLEAHRSAQAQVNARNTKIQALKEELQTLQNNVAHWKAFLAKKLDPEMDPHEVTTIDLLSVGSITPLESLNQPGESAEPARTKKSAKKSEPSAEEQDETQNEESDEERALKESIASEAKALVTQQNLFLSLPSREQEELFQEHLKRQEANKGKPEQNELVRAEAVAESVALQRDAALDASKNADSVAVRLVSDEQAALLDVKHDQAELAVELAERKAHTLSVSEKSLTWERRVRELSSRTELVGNTEGHADALYGQLILALRKTRHELRKTLDTIADHTTEVPTPKAATKVPGQIDTSKLESLRAELAEQALSLQIQREDVWWDHAQVLRDSMVSMNGARLELLDHLSSSKRGALHGFGESGVEQAGRELDEITLEGRFHLLNLPRFARAKLAEYRQSPGSLAFSILKVVFLILAFRWWRRRAHKVLADLRLHYMRARPRTIYKRFAARSVWYLQQIRNPLEWLIMLSLLLNVATDLGKIPEIDYVWIILLWVLLGSVVVLFVNAFVSRQTKAQTDGQLRLRSLRTIGVCVIVVGMALSIARSSVGKGTIYTWVLKTFWVLLIPITFMLIYWWRPSVIARAKATANPNRLVRWVANHDTGFYSFIGSAVGGVYLLTEGFKRAAIKQAGNFSVMQSFLAYLLRRQVEKQGIIAGSDARYAPLDKDALEAITTEFRDDAPTVPISNEEVERVRQLVAKDGNTTIAVAGERGLGKTTFIDRILGTLDADRTIHLRCTAGGYPALLAQLAVACGVPADSNERHVLKALQEGAPDLVAIDDVQRLTRPLIGGLKDIDKLVALARSTSGNTSWLMAIDMPAWQYFRRARGDRAIFDEVVLLKRWTEAEIGELVRLRSKEAEFEPLFDELVLPAQFDTEDIGGQERHTQQNYARILWDYSSGNPAVALRFFEESLGVRDDKVYVRLFRAPPLTELADLPASMYFVLRSVLQLGQAIEKDVVSCTDLNPADVSDALRMALKRNYLVRHGDNIQISLYWYRAIVQVLQRHHLVPEAL